MKIPQIVLQQYEEYKNFNINEIFLKDYQIIDDSIFNIPTNDLFNDYLKIDVVNGVPFFNEENDFISIKKQSLEKSEEENPFVSLNHRFSSVKYLITIAKSPNKPIVICNYYTEENSFITSNIKIILEKDVKVDLLETNISKGDFLGINNRDFLLTDSQLNYSRKDDNNEKSNLIYNYTCEVNKGLLNSTLLNKDGNISINNWNINLNREDSISNIYGVIQINKNKRHGSVCVINHNAKKSKSIQDFRHVLDDNSYAMYHGDTIINGVAIDSDAAQNSKTIMLSDDARILNKPRLNVFTGEVKATHGASVGRFNKEDIFYLKQRGFPENKIKTMLIEAFVNDIVNKIENEKIRGYLYD